MHSKIKLMKIIVITAIVMAVFSVITPVVPGLNASNIRMTKKLSTKINMVTPAGNAFKKTLPINVPLICALFG